MKRLTSLAGLVICLALLVNITFAQQNKPYDLVQLGQSYRTPMEMVQAFAEARGKEFRFKAYLPPGVPIYAHWFKMDKNRGLIGETDYRVLCMIPYYDFNEQSPEAAANFFGLGLKRNPEMRAYIVNHWPSRAMSMEEKQAWIDENLPKFAAMVEKSNADHPDAANPMRLVPRAEAFMDFLRYAEQIPGFTAPASAYNDGGHQSNNSNYMFACMEYAWIYKDNPIGLPGMMEKTRKGKTERLFDLTEQQALALQRLGYYHLTHHPMSGIPAPDDSSKPAKIEAVQVKATPKSVLLEWPEVSDEGSGVWRYRIERSDGQTFENLIARYIDNTIESGKTYTYVIRAEDIAGNLSEPSKAFTAHVPLDRSAPKIAAVEANKAAEILRVVFDEEVNPESAATAQNYSIDGLTIQAARMAAADAVVLETSPMEKDKAYTLVASGIADLAATPNVAKRIEQPFTFTPPTWETFDLTGWDGAEVELEGPQIRITAKGEGNFRSFGKMDKPAIAGIVRTIEGDFDFPLAITSQGQVAATTGLKPYQRKGNVKTGILLAEDISKLDEGKFAVFYLDDSTRFRLNVHRDWIVTARVIGAGLTEGDPRKNRNGLNLPVWIRLVREDADLTAYYSLTGVGPEHWQKLGTIQARKMPEKIQMAIFNTSGVADEHSTAMFDLRATGEEKTYTNVGQ
ncbi:MAG: hypothetical protein ACLFUS_01950 [Candidatus Sumerlaeia bacterium]